MFFLKEENKKEVERKERKFIYDFSVSFHMQPSSEVPDLR